MMDFLEEYEDAFAFWVWFASFADNKVRWRGDLFVLESGIIRPANESSEQVLISATTEPERDNVSVHW